jgi:hypothetical protein
MALKSILTAALLAAATTGASAQEWVSDSVAMGNGYANDAFYDLRSGASKIQNGSDWHLAFQMGVFGEKHYTAGVRANHARKNVEVYLMNKTAATTFAAFSAADTVGKTAAAAQYLNNDTSWGTGAFYQDPTRQASDIFNFGWGYYNSTTHYLDGNNLYLLKTKDGAFKFWIKQYVSTPADSIHYTLRIAKLDGSNDREVKIYRKAQPLFTDRLLGYYDITSNTVLDREPSRTNWDILFTQYTASVTQGGMTIPNYPVTGVLANEGVQIAQVNQKDPDAAKYNTYAYTTQANQIGWDNWKKNDPVTHKYVLPDTVNYFLKTALYKEYYQIRFIRFDGSATGKVVFQKRLIGKESLSVKNLAAAELNAFAVVPNPASAEASLMIDAKKATPNARMIVTDMSGRVVASSSLDIRAGLNAFALNSGNWAAGTYAVTVSGADWKMSSRLVVVR